MMRLFGAGPRSVANYVDQTRKSLDRSDVILSQVEKCERSNCEVIARAMQVLEDARKTLRKANQLLADPMANPSSSDRHDGSASGS